MTAIEHSAPAPAPQPWTAAPLSRTAVASIIAAFIFWPAGLALAVVAMSHTSRRRDVNAKSGRGLALTGLILNAALAVVFLAVVAALVALSNGGASSPTTVVTEEAVASQPDKPAAAQQAPDVALSPVAEEATAAELQAAIDATGGWAHWSDTVVGLEDNGLMVTVQTTLYNKPSNETDARSICAFALTGASGQVDGSLALRVAASDGVSLAKCELPN